MPPSAGELQIPGAAFDDDERQVPRQELAQSRQDGVERARPPRQRVIRPRGSHISKNLDIRSKGNVRSARLKRRPAAQCRQNTKARHEISASMPTRPSRTYVDGTERR